MNIIDKENSKAVMSEDYNYIFNKTNGFFARWGKSQDIDPISAPSPEIADIEIVTGKCSGGCKWCSPAGTKVNTPFGEKNIEELKENDEIYSFNIKNNKKTINKIQETYSKGYKGDLIEIYLENNKILKLTPEHEVLLKNGVWVEAGKLKETDELMDIEIE